MQLLLPPFSRYLNLHQRADVLDLFERLIQSLNLIAMDDQHVSRLYGRFLDRLLKKGKEILVRGSQASISASSSTKDTTSSWANEGPGRAEQRTCATPAENALSMSSGAGAWGSSLELPKLQGQWARDDGYQSIPQQQQQTSFSMSSVQSALPDSGVATGAEQILWPGPSDPEQLMSMHMFGDQFWEDALVCSLIFIPVIARLTFESSLAFRGAPHQHTCSRRTCRTRRR